MTPLESLVAGMTIEQLARRANITVEQLVDKALGGTVRSPVPRATQQTRSAKPSSAPSAIGVPTPKAKTAAKVPPKAKPSARTRGSITDAEVLAILGATSEPVSSEHVRALLGGSPAQIRAALHRLRDKKRVRVAGKKRGTRYAVR